MEVPDCGRIDHKQSVNHGMAFVASLPPAVGKSRTFSNSFPCTPFSSWRHAQSTDKLSLSSFNGKFVKTYAPFGHQRETSGSTPVMLETKQRSKDSGRYPRRPKPTPPPPEVPSRTTVLVTRVLMGVAYVGFLSYGLFLGPGSSLNDSKELENLIAMNFEDVNVVVWSVFFLLGAMPLNYAVALNPGASDKQRLPFLPSALLSFFTGFGGIGPYLITRKYVPSISKQEVASRGIVARILESRWTSVGTAIFSLYCYVRCLGFFANANDALRDIMFYSSFVDFVRLTRADRFVSTSTADLILLSVLLWGPLTEDMRRRGWFVKGGEIESALTALSILAVPGFGAALYFVLRPPLPDQTKTDDEK